MLSINSLTIKYNTRLILDNASANFPRGSVAVIRGASGSGKSSLLNILGLLQSSGKFEYLFDGEDVAGLSEQGKADFRLRRVGFVFQQNELLEKLSVTDNILTPQLALGTGMQTAKKRAEEVLRFVGLTERAGDYPETLSGGESQRVALARAIANDADIILADEPTAALDAENAKNVLELFTKLAHEFGKIVIIVSHSDEVVKYADITYKIENRKITLTDGETNAEKAELNPKTAPRLRGFFRFIRFYKRKQIGDKYFRRIIAAVMAVVTAFVMLSANVGVTVRREVIKIADFVSDRRIFVTNNVFRDRNTFFDQDMYNSLTREQLDSFESMQGVEKVLPYYSFGTEVIPPHKLDKNSKASIKITDEASTEVIAYKEYGLISDSDGPADFRSFSVEPIFEGENFGSLLEYGQYNKDDLEVVYLEGRKAQQLYANYKELVGKKITVSCYVPVKSVEGLIGFTDEYLGEYVQAAVDYGVYKLVTFEAVIAGIVHPAQYDRILRSSLGYSKIYMPYERVMRIIEENKDMDLSPRPGIDGIGMEDCKELMPSAVMVYVDSIADALDVESFIYAQSRDYSVGGDIDVPEGLTNFVDQKQDTFTMLSTAFTTVIAVLFIIVYSLLSRSRKREIGILKALGVSKAKLIKLTLYEITTTAVAAYVAGLIIALLFIKFCSVSTSAWVQAHGWLFEMSVFSAMVGFFASVLITAVAGIIPIYRAAKADPVEAIRRLNK
ncbi:MAG: ABC transporter ATP-binding protein/permease [Oscillospiraceae bacterium]|jgi:ABC-type lipoprotein export system ATPase subunit/ABC-type antimicrobial peptide transport system permease subunit|nr:ABC transporter ATP-binding protein/permease [Oscillospiraceae bacterium]